jgi:hypothetical protein
MIAEALLGCDLDRVAKSRMFTTCERLSEDFISRIKVEDRLKKKPFPSLPGRMVTLRKRPVSGTNFAQMS